MVLTTGFIQPTYICLHQQNYLLYVKSDYSSCCRLALFTELILKKTSHVTRICFERCFDSVTGK